MSMAGAPLEDGEISFSGSDLDDIANKKLSSMIAAAELDLHWLQLSHKALGEGFVSRDGLDSYGRLDPLQHKVLYGELSNKLKSDPPYYPPTANITKEGSNLKLGKTKTSKPQNKRLSNDTEYDMCLDSDCSDSPCLSDATIIERKEPTVKDTDLADLGQRNSDEQETVEANDQPKPRGDIQQPMSTQELLVQRLQTKTDSLEQVAAVPVKTSRKAEVAGPGSVSKDFEEDAFNDRTDTTSPTIHLPQSHPKSELSQDDYPFTFPSEAEKSSDRRASRVQDSSLPAPGLSIETGSVDQECTNFFELSLNHTRSPLDDLFAELNALKQLQAQDELANDSKHNTSCISQDKNLDPLPTDIYRSHATQSRPGEVIRKPSSKPAEDERSPTTCTHPPKKCVDQEMSPDVKDAATKSSKKPRSTRREAAEGMIKLSRGQTKLLAQSKFEATTASAESDGIRNTRSSYGPSKTVGQLAHVTERNVLRLPAESPIANGSTRSITFSNKIEQQLDEFSKGVDAYREKYGREPPWSTICTDGSYPSSFAPKIGEEKTHGMGVIPATQKAAADIHTKRYPSPMSSYSPCPWEAVRPANLPPGCGQSVASGLPASGNPAAFNSRIPSIRGDGGGLGTLSVAPRTAATIPSRPKPGRQLVRGLAAAEYGGSAVVEAPSEVDYSQLNSPRAQQMLRQMQRHQRQMAIQMQARWQQQEQQQHAKEGNGAREIRRGLGM